MRKRNLCGCVKDIEMTANRVGKLCSLKSLVQHYILWYTF